MYQPGKEQATRAELRCPDPACNPYLDLRRPAARRARGHREGLRAAAADGDEPLRPDPRGAGARRASTALPETLGEAIELGAASELLLKCFGEHIHSRYVELKREEWEDYRVQVTPYELERYLPLL